MDVHNMVPKASASSANERPLYINICQTAESILLALACSVAAFLALMSLFTTGKFRALGDRTYLLTTTEDMILYIDFPSIVFIVGAVAFSVFFYGLAYLWSKYSRMKNLGLCLAAYALFFSLLWVLSLNATGNQYVYNDSTSLINAASAIVNNQKELFSPGVPGTSSVPSSYGYFSLYPFQTGALLWFVIIFKFFGAGNIIAVQITNSFLIAGVAWILQIVASQLCLSDFGQRITALLIMTSVPVIMFAAFVYTNLPGLFFALLALLTAIQASRQVTYLKAISWTSLTFFIGAVAVMIKGTVMIFLIAFAIVLIISAVRHKLFWAIPFTLVALYAAKWLSGLSVPLVEHMVGQRFGSGLPQLSWIAIGLTQASAETSMPGWWNIKPIQTYQDTLGNPQLQASVAQDTIRTAVIGFVHNPVKMVEFFGAKLASEWSEPTYQTLYYSALMERRDNSMIASHAFFGASNSLLISFQNVHQSIVYTFSSIGFGYLFRNRRLGKSTVSENMEALFLALIFLGGFACFLLWEAKSIYVLPFAIVLIPIAGYGIEHVGNMAKQRIMNR